MARTLRVGVNNELYVDDGAGGLPETGLRKALRIAEITQAEFDATVSSPLSAVSAAILAESDTVYSVAGALYRRVGANWLPIYSVTGNRNWLNFTPTGGNVPDLNTASVGFTHHAMVELADAFDLVRITLHNFDTANPLVITSVSVAVGDGSSVENSGATYTVLLPAPITIPVARSINGRVYPTVAYTPAAYLPSVARASGLGAMLFVRIYTAAASTPNISVWQTGGNTGAGWESSGSRLVAARYQSGDFTSTNQAGFNATTVRGFTPVFGVEYVPKSGGGTSVLTLGNSLTNGGLVTNKAWNYQLAQILRTGGRVFDYANYGVSQATADEFLANAKYLIPLLRPKVVMVPAWTPNSGPNNIEQMRTAFVGIQSLCRQYGAKFIPWNGTPRSTGVNTTPFYTADEAATQLAWMAEAAAIAGGVMVDMNAALSGGASQAYANSSDTVDGLHLTTAGYGKMAAAASKYVPAFL